MNALAPVVDRLAVCLPLLLVSIGLAVGAAWLLQLWRERPAQVRLFCYQLERWLIALLACVAVALIWIPVVICCWFLACFLCDHKVNWSLHE
jgi:hypothetical protein